MGVPPTIRAPGTRHLEAIENLQGFHLGLIWSLASMELMEFWPMDGSTMFHCTQVLKLLGQKKWECAPRTVRMLGVNVKSCLDSNILAHLFPLGNPPLGYLVLQTSQLIKAPMVHRPIERPFTKAPRLGQIENPSLVKCNSCAVPVADFPAPFID